MELREPFDGFANSFYVTRTLHLLPGIPQECKVDIDDWGYLRFSHITRDYPYSVLLLEGDRTEINLYPNEVRYEIEGDNAEGKEYFIERYDIGLGNHYTAVDSLFRASIKDSVDFRKINEGICRWEESRFYKKDIQNMLDEGRITPKFARLLSEECRRGDVETLSLAYREALNGRRYNRYKPTQEECGRLWHAWGQLMEDPVMNGLDMTKFLYGSSVSMYYETMYYRFTDEAKKDSIMSDFALKSERVHTVNQLLKAYAMFEKDVDYVIMDNKVKIVDEQTGRIMEGRRWSDGLHQAVEAKENVKVEAATQTFATITLQNYFRMYHKLAGMTGTAETEAGEFWSIYKLDVVVIPTNKPIARIDENDRIYKTKKAKYEAVINRIEELIKAGRPVLVGTTDVETSELLSRMLKLRGITHQVLNAKQHAREAEIVAQAGQRSTVTIATNMAGRGTDIKLSDEVRKAGGLAIIGTERHDSRRVDRQLRGRAGRQGDPGSSTFYVSFEDKLMRLFGSERIASVVDKLGMEENDALENNMLSNSIEKAQKKVEENNFGIRKRLLEYDDVMNSQREVIYTRRRNALSGERVEIDVMNMMQDMSEIIVETCAGYDYGSFAEYVMATLSVDLGFDESFYNSAKPAEISARLYQNMQDTYRRRMDAMSQRAYPIIKDVFEKQGAIYQNIAIPISDGRKMLTLSVNLKKAYETEGKEIARALTKAITLYQIDDHWKEHLRDMDDLKQSVQNASYEQKDPLLIYKFESFNLFKSMLESLSKDILSFLMRAHIPLRDAAPVQKAQAPIEPRQDMSQMRTSRTDLVTNGGDQKSRMPVHVDKTVGRNDPCPCGSGKKYKNCHGRGL